MVSTFASEPDRFGRAFFIAIAIEALAVAAFMLAPKAPPPVTPPVVQIHVMQPAPAPVAKPPPPVPLPPTPPVPTPPVPIAPPLPLPPLPPLRPTDHPVHTRHVVKPPPPPPPNSPPPEPAPPAPVTAAPPPISSAVALTLISRYTGEIHAIVLSHLVVPAQLVQTGLSGTCVLRFTLSPGGDILSASIITPSGISAVNEAAMQALRASRFPAFLAGMPQENHEFELSVHVSGQDE